MGGAPISLQQVLPFVRADCETACDVQQHVDHDAVQQHVDHDAVQQHVDHDAVQQHNAADHCSMTEARTSPQVVGCEDTVNGKSQILT